MLFADSYSVFKRRLWQLKTTKTQNIFSFSSQWQNSEPRFFFLKQLTFPERTQIKESLYSCKFCDEYFNVAVQKSIIYILKGPLLFADSYSVFKRRLWQLKTTKIHNIFSFSSYWQNREPKVCSTNIWHSFFFTYKKIENTLWISVTYYYLLLDFGYCDWFVFMKFT